MVRILRKLERCFHQIKVVHSTELFTVVDLHTKITQKKLKLSVKVSIVADECRFFWSPVSFYRVRTEASMNNQSKSILGKFRELKRFKHYTIKETLDLPTAGSAEQLTVLTDIVADRYIHALENTVHSELNFKQ